MSTCLDVLSCVEQTAPFDLACEWDNVGLLVGNADKEIKKLLICIDNDMNVVKEAEAVGADLILSHHPIMFSPIKRMVEADPQQRLVRRICALDICHVAAHTNIDCARGGLNDYLAYKLGFESSAIMEETAPHAGFGRYVKLEAETSLADLIKLCKEKLNLDCVNYAGALDKKITAIAMNCGSGSDILERACEMGADVLITGDVKYTAARKALDLGVAVIDAGHYGTEIIFKEMMAQKLENSLSDVEIILSKADVPVIKSI